MGVRVNLFVSEPDKVADYSAGFWGGPNEGQWLSEITDLQFGVLHALLKGAESSPEFNPGVVYESPAGGQTVSHLPQGFVTLLTELDGDAEAIRSAAESWVASGDMGSWSVDEAASLIEELISLAWQTDGDRRGLYVWVSL